MRPTSGIGFLSSADGDAERVHVRKLALVGRHAGRGVALDVLDRAHALLDRQAHILGANVVLEIDERFCATIRSDRRRGDMGGAKRGQNAADSVGSRHRRRESGRGRRRASGCVAVHERAREIEGRVAGPGRPFALSRRARLEELQRLVEDELAARLREEMHRRRPSARHEQRVAGDSSIRAHMPDPNRVDPQATVDASNLGAGNDLDARGSRGIRQRSLGLAAQIGNQRDADACLLEVERRAVGAVVRRRDDDAVADLGAILARNSAARNRRASRPGGHCSERRADARSRRSPAPLRARASAIAARAASRDRR